MGVPPQKNQSPASLSPRNQPDANVVHFHARQPGKINKCRRGSTKKGRKAIRTRLLQEQNF